MRPEQRERTMAAAGTGTLEELMQAALAAAPQRRDDALRVLQGQCQAVDPSRQEPAHEPYLTLADVAQRLRVNPSTLWRWQVPSHRFGGRPRYRLAQVEAYLQSEDFQRRAAALRAERCNPQPQPTKSPSKTKHK